ncbi:MAG: DUF423 domain-containing protein [Saprospiraceae bacterium]|nr:DUF423 domain-containing protein [Saprospiraceae bacterium]
MFQANVILLIRLAAAMGAAAVAIGAFGAHGLKPKLDAYQLGIFEKGVQYHFYHSLALLGAAVLLQIQPGNPYFKWAGFLFVAGILLFSGSLYLLATRNLLPFSVSWAGPITPLGGLCFIAGWLLLFWGTVK